MLILALIALFTFANTLLLLALLKCCCTKCRGKKAETVVIVERETIVIVIPTPPAGTSGVKRTPAGIIIPDGVQWPPRKAAAQPTQPPTTTKGEQPTVGVVGPVPGVAQPEDQPQTPNAPKQGKKGWSWLWAWLPIFRTPKGVEKKQPQSPAAPAAAVKDEQSKTSLVAVLPTTATPAPKKAKKQKRQSDGCLWGCLGCLGCLLTPLFSLMLIVALVLGCIGLGLFVSGQHQPVAAVTAVATPTPTPTQPVQPQPTPGTFGVVNQCQLGTDSSFASETVFQIGNPVVDTIRPNDVLLYVPSVANFSQHYAGWRFGDGVDGSSAGGWQHPSDSPKDLGIPWLTVLHLEISAPQSGIIQVTQDHLWASWTIEQRGSCEAFVLTLSDVPSVGATPVKYLEWSVTGASSRTLTIVA